MAAQMNINTAYEELYGIGLLDDLHNFFPAILYEANRFQSVTQLLQYIRQQARNRFDLFSFGERAYEDTQVRSRQRTTTASVSLSFEAPASLHPNIPIPSNAPAHNAPDAEDDLDEGEGAGVGPSDSQNMDRLLMVALMDILANGSHRSSVSVRPLQNPLGSSLSSLLNGRDSSLFTFDNLLQPVVVRPTQDQITAGSQLLQLTEPDHCSICQDSISTTQPARRLTVCQHVFHQGCIDTWYNRNVHCPICRHDIREQNQNQNAEAQS